LPGTEVRLADDGEVLIRSAGVMAGYHNLPEATAEVLDDDGWLHTGDVGEIADGFVTITDRKKELIKTSGGKYVSPQNIENQFKAACPYVSNVVVHGDRRPFCTALVTLDEAAILEWAESAGVEGDYGDLVGRTEVHDLVQACLDAVNASLARHETIKSFAILPGDLSIEGGEITPSLKVKRRVVEGKYQTMLDGMYPHTVEEL
jgi:long-chain acyl-CoA synthetase